MFMGGGGPGAGVGGAPDGGMAQCCMLCCGATYKNPSPRATTLGKVLFALVVLQAIVASSHLLYFGIFSAITGLATCYFGYLVSRRFVIGEYQPGSCVYCCATTQMLLQFLIMVAMSDLTTGIVDVVEVATYDHKGKMGKFNIAKWQYIAAVVVTISGVVLDLVLLLVGYLLWKELQTCTDTMLPEEGGAGGFGFGGLPAPSQPVMGSTFAPPANTMDRNFVGKGQVLGQPAPSQSGRSCCSGRGDAFEPVTDGAAEASQPTTAANDAAMDEQRAARRESMLQAAERRKSKR